MSTVRCSYDEGLKFASVTEVILLPKLLTVATLHTLSVTCVCNMFDIYS